MSETVTQSVHIDHDGDSTLASGTSRSDTATNEALKAAGFRWSRRLEAWYLPRTWREATRWHRISELVRNLGEDAVSISADRATQMTPAEHEQHVRERAAERAERMNHRAAQRTAEAEQQFARADQISDGIPMGQPILVGHHSQRRHERDLERMWTATRKGLDADAEARSAAAAAIRAEKTADGESDSQVTIGNRVERLEAEERRLTRRLTGTGHAIYGEDSPATGNYRGFLEAELQRTSAQLAHERTKVITPTHGPDTITKGDFVCSRGTWFVVRRVNKKSVSVPNAMIPTYNDTIVWREITDHAAASTLTTEQAANILRQSRRGPFGELFEVIRETVQQIRSEQGKTGE